MMAEVDVALTDYVLAIECAAFACALEPSDALPRWLASMFAALAIGSAAGGTVHGFCRAGSIGERVLWPLALLALGLASLSAWGAGACLVASDAWVARIVAFAGVACLAYAAAVVAGAQTFAFAIANLLVASAFLTVGLATEFVRTHESGALVAAAGMGLVFAGAGMQHARVACRGLHLTHNGLFHVVQAAALAILFCGARRLTGRY
jgi:hypothetical protein